MARRRYQRGSIVLRGKRSPAWIGRWREDVILNGQVKRVRKSEFLGYKTDFPTMKLALRELEARLAHVNRPNYRPLRTETFSQFSDWWAKNVMTQYKRSTQAILASQLRVHLNPYFGKLLMKDIQWKQVQSFVYKCPQGPKTRKNLIYTLKLLWKSARAGGWVNHDPFEDLTLPKLIPAAPFFYTADEAKLIIASSEGQPALRNLGRKPSGNPCRD